MLLAGGYLTHQTLTRGKPYTVAEVNTPGPTLGVSSKTLTLVADLACPHCADFDRVKGQHLEQQAQAGKLQFAYLLVARQEGGDLAGNAALCVFEQNPQAFWAYKSTLYSLDTLREETLIQAAAPLNLNQATFKMCVKNQTHAKTLNPGELRLLRRKSRQPSQTVRSRQASDCSR
jgi:protein-disulfide isomerase